MASPSAACAFCGQPLALDQVLYAPDARITCAACNAKRDIHESEVRGGHNIRNASISSLIVAVASVLFNPFWLLTLGSMLSAIGSLVASNRRGDERFTRHADQGAIYACSIIALVINAIVIVISLLAIATLATVRQTGEF